MRSHPLMNRRQFLSQTGTGLASIGLAQILSRQGLLGAEKPFRPDIDSGKPFAPRPPHFQPKANRVLMIFCSGACSQLDTFDYKPELVRHHGKPMPGADKLVTFQGQQGALNQSPWQFRPYGKSGKMVSDLVPHLGEMADDMCFIHSMKGETNTHGPGENFMSTGYTLDGFPSVGSWVTYALGTEDQNLPSYVAIPDPRGKPQNSANNWGAGFLPAAFQGTDFNAARPIRNLNRPGGIGKKEDRATRSFLEKMNQRHLENFPGDTELAARIASYELAARMQLSVPEVSDLSDEPEHILKMYGAESDGSSTLNIREGYAKNCILARRLIEKGVRMVQLFHGAYQTGGEGVSNWDGHKQLKDQYTVHGKTMDQPTAALLKDLKQRGLLDDTLVVWCTEFGRMPTFQKGSQGRDHNPEGFTCWLAGAGVRAGYSHGATDEFGHRSVENVVTVHDFHATILHLMGLDHKRLTFYHNGFERRLTNVHGNIVYPVLG